MQLKEYQVRCLERVKDYLEKLSEQKTKYDKAKEAYPDLNDDFVQTAWEKSAAKWSKESLQLNYSPKKDGLGNHLPNFCLKVPTGGGKTLLAAHSIDLINRFYLKQKTGFVLWVVPTNQIYRQTLDKLNDREHPYRQVLDLSSGGRTQILEKTDKFTSEDLKEKLVVMVVMLASASRKIKEFLKFFQDAEGFESFFPYEDDLKAHEILLKKFPNLHSYGKQGGMWGRQIMTSLGNVIKILQPVLILDEGQKADSDLAKETIKNFNPRFVVELSATPPPGSNKLVDISGQDLNRAQMIKLDINITNKTSTNWKDTLMASVAQRNFLEEKAREYEANSGVYIRPICLVQVEVTGAKQLEKGKIHAEHAREYLIRDCLIPKEQVAVKSSEKDEIDEDLYSKDCAINYIITHKALQEGWDCSFAYILTILTNPKSKNALTQLVGRVLRQPNATKTKVKELDECYVYCYQQSAGALMKAIRSGLQGEGLGDIAGRVAIHKGNENDHTQEDVRYRTQFKKFLGKIYLPHFIMQEEGGWRELRYEMDLVSRIDWKKIDISELKALPLKKEETKDKLESYTLSSDISQVVEKKEANTFKTGSLKIDLVFMTRHIMEVIPNPWVAYKIAEDAINGLKKKDEDEMIAANLVYIVEELLKILRRQKDELAEEVFKKLIKERKVCFFLQKGTGFVLPPNIKVTKSNILFNMNKGEPIQRSLFDKVDKDDMNSLEESVAVCLDEQDKLLWWYRSIARVDYYVQGWKSNKIYPDFIAAKKNVKDKTDYSKVYVLETKGNHLDNPDTKYKQSIFDLCNSLGKQKPWNELELEFSQREIEFQVVFENEWKKKVMEDFN